MIRPTATHAYGFILCSERLERWAMEHCPDPDAPDMSTLSPEEAMIELSVVRGVASTVLPMRIYRDYPRLPSEWHRLILMDDCGRYLLVLKDNGTVAQAMTKLEPEDVEGVRARLELGAQKPKWYRIPE
ncbi:hypothetical protein DENSPDRAFT_834902 [Dentipellis sp. KUC8613]|nr:hypothetical protein DENSPDRAFT_834902 [Dentipellis sp. KUC8613]